MKLHVLMEEGNETTCTHGGMVTNYMYSSRKVMKLHVLMEDGIETTCTHGGR